MHVKSLKVFCDVVGRRSFSRAADDNGMTQSGASQIVHQLEDHLGVKLLDRSKRPFELTAEGHVYYEGCRRLVKRFYSLEEEVRSLHEKIEGEVHIDSIYSVGLSYMKQFVQGFKERFPRAQVHLEYHQPDSVYERVKNGEVDIGLVSYPRKSRSLTTIPWREEVMVLVASPDHPLAQLNKVSLAQLEGHELVAFSQGLAIRRETDRLLARAGVDARVVLEFDNIEMLKRAIEINSGVSLLPAPTVTRELESGTLTTAQLVDVDFMRPLAIIHRRSAELGRTARRFIELLAADVTRGESTHGGSNGRVNGRAKNQKRSKRKAASSR